MRLTGTPLGTDARRPVSGREKKKSWSASSASTLSPSLGLSRLLRHKRHELTATVAPSGRRFLSVERASLPQSAWFAFPPNLHPPPPSAGVELNRRWFDCRGGWLACLSYPPPPFTLPVKPLCLPSLHRRPTKEGATEPRCGECGS